MRKFHLSASSKNNALTVEIRRQKCVGWSEVGFGGQVWSHRSNIYLDHGHVWIWRLFIRIIFIIFRFPGTVCRIVSLNFYRFWVTFYDFWNFNFFLFFDELGWIPGFLRIHPSYNFRGFHSKTTIWVQKWNFWNFSKFTLVKAKQISKMSFFQKPLNWVFGKTLKYQIKKLNTWPGQLEHALLTFRTPLAPT